MCPDAEQAGLLLGVGILPILLPFPAAHSWFQHRVSRHVPWTLGRCPGLWGTGWDEAFLFSHCDCTLGPYVVWAWRNKISFEYHCSAAAAMSAPGGPWVALLPTLRFSGPFVSAVEEARGLRLVTVGRGVSFRPLQVGSWLSLVLRNIVRFACPQ